MITIIVIIIAGFIIKFIIDTNKQTKDVAKQGGIVAKYSVLIGRIREQDERTLIKNITGDSVTIELSSVGGLTAFELTQTYGMITIIWKMNSPVFGMHTKEWEFDENSNQRHIYEKIECDLIEYQNSNLSNLGVGLNDSITTKLITETIDNGLNTKIIYRQFSSEEQEIISENYGNLDTSKKVSIIYFILSTLKSNPKADKETFNAYKNSLLQILSVDYADISNLKNEGFQFVVNELKGVSIYQKEFLAEIVYRIMQQSGVDEQTMIDLSQKFDHIGITQDDLKNIIANMNH